MCKNLRENVCAWSHVIHLTQWWVVPKTMFPVTEILMLRFKAVLWVKIGSEWQRCGRDTNVTTSVSSSYRCWPYNTSLLLWLPKLQHQNLLGSLFNPDVYRVKLFFVNVLGMALAHESIFLTRSQAVHVLLGPGLALIIMTSKIHAYIGTCKNKYSFSN